MTNCLKLIARANRFYGRAAEMQLRQIGLAMSQIPVLVNLKAGALGQADLARIVGVEQPSMAQLLNRMERDGLITRFADPTDRRSRLISLTETAVRRLPSGRSVLDAVSRRALAGFSKEEIDQLAVLLERVNANLEPTMQARSICKNESK